MFHMYGSPMQIIQKDLLWTGILVITMWIGLVFPILMLCKKVFVLNRACSGLGLSPKKGIQKHNTYLPKFVNLLKNSPSIFLQISH